MYSKKKKKSYHDITIDLSEVTNDLLNFAGKPNTQINWLRASHFSWETNLCE